MGQMPLPMSSAGDDSQSKREVVAPGVLYEVLGNDPKNDRWAFYFDASMMGNFSDCETKFQYAYHYPDGDKFGRLQLRGDRSFSMSVGSWWSAVMSDFYELMAAGNLLLAHVMESAGRNWVKLKMDEFKTLDPKRYEAFGGDSGALLMISQYFTAQADIDRQSWRIIATEAGFGRKRECLIGENDKVVVYLIGVPDLIILTQERLMPVDHKTKDKIDRDIQGQFKPHRQTAGYIYSTNLIAKDLGYDRVVDRCVINVAARSEPTDKPRDGIKRPRFTRVYPSYSQEELKEWQADNIADATRMREAIETDHFRHNDQACHKYNRNCAYRPICSVKPSSRLVVIKANYEVAKAWVPYEVDE